MKKIFIIIFSCALLFSCSKDDAMLSENESYQTNDISNFTSVVTNLEETLSITEGKSVTFKNHEIIVIDSEFYLRSDGTEKFTTTLLKKLDNGTFQTRGISCTSDACSSSQGCIPRPDGQSCTPCPGDCKKIVSSGGDK